MKTLVITGASGFIGLNIVEVFLKRGWRVRALSSDGIARYAQAEFARLPGKLEDVVGDARDSKQIEALFYGDTVDAVVAAAAITSGPHRERSEPATIFEVNLVATLRLLELAAANQVARMLLFSSAAAMGDLPFEGRVVSEADRARPISLYGATKAALETVATRWASLSDTPRLFVARLTAAVGPWERDTGVRDTLSPPFAIIQSALAGEAIAPLPGGGARDYAYAPEVAEQIHWLLSAGAPAPRHQLYQLSSGFTWHASQMIAALQAEGVAVRVEAGGREIALNDDLTRRRFPLSAARISEEFRPPPSAEETARDYVRWALAHREWFGAR